MAGLEQGGDSGGKTAGKHKKKKSKRVPVRIDMTPLVDIAFLLLTFFMLTTVFSKPQTMELNLPPDDETQVEVAESNLMTLRIMADSTIWHAMGSKPPEQVEFTKFREFLLESNRSNPKLITLVKVAREGSYALMVDIMDELNLANVTRFSLAQMTDKDKSVVEKVRS
jgi:biopolymer transport protein ExbD